MREEALPLCGCPGRDIPEPIRREVRQRCGFGCVFCAMPIVAYHHITPWAQVREHTADNITLVCDNHHRQAGAGLIPPEEVRQANESPRAFQVGELSPNRVFYGGGVCQVQLGQAEFVYYPIQPIQPVIEIDGAPLLAIRTDDNRLSIDLDPFPRGPIGFRIRHNEVELAPHWWDITFEGRVLTIRVGQRRIAFEIEFASPQRVSVRRGLFVHNGLALWVHRGQAIFLNRQFRVGGIQFNGFTAGLSIGEPVSTAAAIRLPCERDSPLRRIRSPER